YSGDSIFGRSADGHGALHNDDGSLREAGTAIVVPHLADSLGAIAEEGPGVFYTGDIGKRIVNHVQDHGGLLTIDDLQNYAPQVRDSLMIDVGDWQIATNPPPAIGGASLAAMLHTFGTEKISSWDNATLARLYRTQRAVMSYRIARLDSAADITGPVAELLDAAQSDTLLSKWASGATVHTSTVDRRHLACSITASSGYGAGEMPDQTGLWLNNCLGELELNPQGLTAEPPGRRLPSNMAPSAARSATAVLAIGSPGADRITTALHQFLVNFAQLGLDLDDAVAHPRMHLKIDGSSSTLAVEPGLPVPELGVPIRRYPEPSMYFGGVVAAYADTRDVIEVAADPRREGGTFVSNP
ncbi:MAG: gamma-glutamyltransferase, partial [Woeseiaceae bacterium]